MQPARPYTGWAFRRYTISYGERGSVSMSETPELRAHVRFVREHSAFYREFYERVPEVISSLDQLPILDQDAFWAANTMENNRLLTEKPKDGIILKSGGTTGQPKFSI